MRSAGGLARAMAAEGRARMMAAGGLATVLAAGGLAAMLAVSVGTAAPKHWPEGAEGLAAPAAPHDAARRRPASGGDDGAIRFACLPVADCAAEAEAEAAGVRAAPRQAPALAAVPLPAALSLMGVGMALLGLFLRRRQDAG